MISWRVLRNGGKKTIPMKVNPPQRKEKKAQNPQIGSGYASGQAVHPTYTPPLSVHQVSAFSSMGSSISEAKAEGTVQAATVQQREASDPFSSVFVSASAGSGKTKVLVERLLRLMLPHFDGQVWQDGSPPQRVLCLTYTRAAATEMAVRLQETLGEWVSLDRDSLSGKLEKLGIYPASGITEPEKTQLLIKARALFLQVLDMPGGMRISTIHAFCQSLLRLFPLEAEISPYFTLIEEEEGKQLQGIITEQNIVSQPQAVAVLSEQMAFADIQDVMQKIYEGQHHFSSLQGGFSALSVEEQVAFFAREARKVLKIKHDTEEEVVKEAFALLCSDSQLLATLQTLQASSESGKTIKERTSAMLGALQEATQMADQATEPPFLELWEKIKGCFLKKNKNEVLDIFLPGKLLETKHPEHFQDISRLIGFLVEREEARTAIRLFKINNALYQLVVPIIAAYGQLKRKTGRLDYNDLISTTIALLKDPGSAWVLYRMDGGIDHVLLDEVQDTSYRQWDIAASLTEEFFAGEGQRAEGTTRTIFAVGDIKQSIFSFQEAEPQAFLFWRKQFQKRVEEAGQKWKTPELTVSFRSSSPILKMVDAVIEQTGMPFEEKRHVSARGGYGRVELWPLLEEDRQTEKSLDWWDIPQEYQKPQENSVRLAETLASWIKQEISKPAQGGHTPLAAGDILILLRKRSAFSHNLIRALKAQNIPVISSLATSLKHQVVVQDLLTLCDVLLLPEDDLSLACVLTSPIGNISDSDLLKLTRAGQEPTLWKTLQKHHNVLPNGAKIWDMLSTLFGMVDFASPYVLLSEVLGKWNARTRFLARLGTEAAESIDDILDAALAYETEEAPSVQGFVHSVRNSEKKTSQVVDAKGGQVRMMTVHGAKGLQARLVILPQTHFSENTHHRDPKIFWLETKMGVKIPLWVPRKDLHVSAISHMVEQKRRQDREESYRLLYVALTRAEERLIICDSQSQAKAAKTGDSWYTICQAALQNCDARQEPFSLGWGESLSVLEGGIASGSIPGVQPYSSASFQEITQSEEIVQSQEITHTQSEDLLETPAGMATREEALPSGPHSALPEWIGTPPSWQGTPVREQESPAALLVPSRPEGVEFGHQPAVYSPLQERGNIYAHKAREKGKLIHGFLRFLPSISSQERAFSLQQWLKRPAYGFTEQERQAIERQVLELLHNPVLQPLFSDDARAEQPLAATIGHTVIVGQVDRMCVLKDRVMVCDFKTGRQPPATVEETPTYYLTQMASYRAILQKLYPQMPVECYLIWTEYGRADLLPSYLLDKRIDAVL
ncbi:UvrD-helicase domain-containing protein [Entomobacter blattae]|uniref:DNA 3'-5' helicase n=1 Tax=Entomobacter blattae TaxID=2762277 RepID=A0A7H1NPZ0_9PROT|nr:UvrD-helicase domain-containing protein [Entomobacter blattae]QNT77850.1 ATP-dependent helicase/nuclease subunit A [Entomobacter blattae]